MAAPQKVVPIDSACGLDVLLRCPVCASEMSGMECPACAFQAEVMDGIVRTLPRKREDHFARFMKEYEYIREAEGRSSETPAFYLGLPYKDITGRNSAQWMIRARSYEYMFRNVLVREMPDGGLILDLGAGNCWMSYRLALAGYKPVAVDLLTNDRDGMGAARHFTEILPGLFSRFQAEMESLPFQNEQFDAVIFNASFHYTENYKATLGEALRCVRPKGVVIVCDTPWYSRDASGRQMLKERQDVFLKKYGMRSDSITGLEYLTDERLRDLEGHFAIRWRAYAPNYGLKWAMRPLLAALRRRREPSRFRIYVARKSA